MPHNLTSSRPRAPPPRAPDPPKDRDGGAIVVDKIQKNANRSARPRLRLAPDPSPSFDHGAQSPPRRLPNPPATRAGHFSGKIRANRVDIGALGGSSWSGGMRRAVASLERSAPAPRGEPALRVLVNRRRRQPRAELGAATPPSHSSSGFARSPLSASRPRGVLPRSLRRASTIRLLRLGRIPDLRVVAFRRPLSRVRLRSRLERRARLTPRAVCACRSRSSALCAFPSSSDRSSARFRSATRFVSARRSS